MPPVTVGELQVILSGDLSRLDRDMDRIDNRAGATEKKHTAAWQRTGTNAGQAIRLGMLVAERDADKIGGRTGGKLAQGINSGLIRNSPLIVAGVAGALAAGAPLVTAGAVALFAGAGAVAASQSLEIRESWTQLGHEIRGGMVADAAVLVPAYTKMADKIGESFQRMRPMIREAFADSVPLVDSFTDGVIALAENAMPGLTRSVAAAGPVMDGFEDFLATVGTGLTDFFDAISSHSPAAGTAFASLGDILGDLLPILGELLGQGAEIAADVLPAVAYATGTVLDVMQTLGPMLPSVVAGFVAFKAAQTAAGYMQTFGMQARFATGALTGSATAANVAGTAVSGIGKALPAVGIAFGLAGAQMAASEQKVNDWAQAILDGGRAAQEAAQQAREAASGFNEFIDSMQFGDQESPFEAMFGADDEKRFAEAEQAARDLYDAMSPLQQAQQDVDRATNDLSMHLADYGVGTGRAASASRVLEAEQAVLAQRQGELELAIEGVTSAMIAQAEQALAAASSDYAYRQSLEGIDDAVSGITEAQRVEAEAAKAAAEAKRVHGASSDEAAEAARRHTEATEATSDAQFRLEGTLLGAAEAAGRLAADALPATASELQKQQAAAAGSLTELERLKTEMGANFPPALQLAIDRLKQSGVALADTSRAGNVTAASMRDLGLSVTEIPGQKFVKVDAPTAEQKQRLIDLGYTVTELPNGDIYVSANTAEAEAALARLERDRFARVYINEIITKRAGSTYNDAIGGRASGGPVVARTPYIVGEEGQELFVPDVPGTIIDAKKTAAMLAAAGNRHAAAMLPALGGGSGGRSMSLAGGSAGTGSASVAGVTEKHYHMHAAVTHTLTLPEFMRLQKQADALYG